MDESKAIDEVKASLSRADRETALRHALNWWRVHRSSALGALIRVITEGSSFEPEIRPDDDFDVRWHGIARYRTENEAVGWLAANLVTRLPRSRHWGDADETRPDRTRFLLARLRVLGRNLPDPRIADAALGALEGRGAIEKSVVELGLAVVQRHGDFRHAAALSDIATRSMAAQSNDAAFLSRAAEKVRDALARRLADRDDGDRGWATLLPSDWTQRRNREALIGELLESVYREPMNRDLRGVVADALLELGDPRGELISLQRIASPSAAIAARIAELERENIDAWLGADLSAVMRAVRFRDGFPAIATLEDPSGIEASTWERALADPRLSTFEKIHRGKAPKWRHDQFLAVISALRANE